jgi:hypothetical protein
MGIGNRMLETPIMHTAVITLALTVLSRQDVPIPRVAGGQPRSPVYSPYINLLRNESGPAWFKIVDAPVANTGSKNSSIPICRWEGLCAWG